MAFTSSPSSVSLHTRALSAELGCEATVVKDATADFSDEEMHAELDAQSPNYASAIVTPNEVVEAPSFPVPLAEIGSNA